MEPELDAMSIELGTAHLDGLLLRGLDSQASFPHKVNLTIEASLKS